MPISVHFRPRMTIAQYDEVMRRLAQAGAAHPPGRTYHACFTTGDKLEVFDVWDSLDLFEQFGGTLIPILSEVGVDPGQPEIGQVQNIVAPGATAGAALS